LNHAAVESAELKTLYDGRVRLGPNGTAAVALPSWFDSLNGSLRYVLTALGAPAPDLHISREFDGISFEISGGNEGTSVCWQVTGIRKDSAALSHPLIVEQDKPETDQQTIEEFLGDVSAVPVVGAARSARVQHSHFDEVARQRLAHPPSEL
jgi:hypothetical protein